METNREMNQKLIFVITGGFAYVFLVQDSSSGEYYALKRLIVPDKERMNLTQQEIDIMVFTLKESNSSLVFLVVCYIAKSKRKKNTLAHLFTTSLALNYN